MTFDIQIQIVLIKSRNIKDFLHSVAVFIADYYRIGEAIG